jgi:glycosyltransferase involved in cell wall biosynthesis
MSRSWEPDLSIVIPAFNEQDAVVGTLSELRSRLPDSEVILVDDGSKDDTCARALSVEGARVVRHTFNRGYGAALKTGMRYATRRYVAWFDSDNEHRVEDLIAMVERIATEGLVAVIGRRRLPGPSVLRKSGKWAIRLLALTLGVRLGKDVNCGLRVFRREFIMRYSAVLPDAFSASLTSTMILIERGHAFAFYDIDVKPRIGSSKVRVMHGFATLALVLRIVLLFAPMRVFFAPGVVMLIAGIVYGMVKATTSGQGIPVAGLLVTMTGLLSAMLGLIADQISQLRLSQLCEFEELASEEVSRPAHDATRALPVASAQGELHEGANLPAVALSGRRLSS